MGIQGPCTGVDPAPGRESGRHRESAFCSFAHRSADLNCISCPQLISILGEHRSEQPSIAGIPNRAGPRNAAYTNAPATRNCLVEEEPAPLIKPTGTPAGMLC